MGRSAFAAVVAAFASLAPAAQPASPGLTAPSFSIPGQLVGLAASGTRVAVAAECDVRVARLVGTTRPVKVRGGPCADREFEGFVYDLWLGRRSVVAELLDAPSPHGEVYSRWKGPLPAGPLRPLGDEWGWSDSSDEPASGCVGVVAAGGGVIASTEIPNRLAVIRGFTSTPACPAGETTVIRLDGASRAVTSVRGSWTLLATDGRRLALSRLDALGRATGELSLFGLDGRRLPTPRVPPGTVKAAFGGWLAPEGLVLSTRAGITGPGWTLHGVYVASVGYGRVVYLRGRTLRVHRIKGTADRRVLTLPTDSQNPLVAGGSFGVAVAVQTERPGENFRTTLYRLPWRTIDAALPRR